MVLLVFLDVFVVVVVVVVVIILVLLELFVIRNKNMIIKGRVKELIIFMNFVIVVIYLYMSVVWSVKLINYFI